MLVQTRGQYAGTIIACIILGFMRHAIAKFRHNLGRANVPGADVHSPMRMSFLANNYLALRVVDVLLFAAVAVVGFFNMLIVMTYNPGLFMAIVLGEMVGVFAFEPPTALYSPVRTDTPDDELRVGMMDGSGYQCH